ncbi:APC family permease [Paraburkholderia bengalensis]|uniref:APC family permease n=1 Tax=Paraburkholderia bengalensis TaxID=2747562 RepID=A0ABU8ILY2_9BURK
MTELRRRISPFGGTALAVGMVVGSGVFGLPGLAVQVSSPQIAAFGWLVCAVACSPLLCVFAILGTRYASAAGISRYAEAALGRRAEYAVTAVLCGTFPLTVPVQSMIGASYALVASGLDQRALLPLAAMILGIAVISNLCGVRTTAFVNTVSLGLIVTAVLALGAARPETVHAGILLWTHPDWSGMTLSQIWKVSALLFWAFLGWENVSFGLEEFEEPQRTIKRVYFFSFVVVVVLYFFLAAAVNGAGDDLRVNTTEGIARLVPSQWQTPFALVTLAVIQATANAWVFAASRLFYSAGRNHLLPEIFAALDKKGNPRNAVLLVAACFAIVLIATAALHLGVQHLVMLVDQNFLVLYLVCIFACWKIGTRLQRWLLTPLALLSCGFLLAGFSYTILYPLLLLAVGVMCQRSRARPGLINLAENTMPPNTR